MGKLDQLRESNVWDPQYDLPLVPNHNNPHFFMALSIRVIGDETDQAFRVARSKYVQACEKSHGLFHRWPSHAHNLPMVKEPTSHDELIGIAFFDAEAAQRILNHLASTDGEYNDTLTPDPLGKWNLYRFTWFMSWLKASAGIKLSLISQVLWAAHVVFDGLKTKENSQDASGRLLIWLMLPQATQYEIMAMAGRWWRKTMKRKGITPKKMLLLEPKENPILAALAPEEF